MYVGKLLWTCTYYRARPHSTASSCRFNSLNSTAILQSRSPFPPLFQNEYPTPNQLLSLMVPGTQYSLGLRQSSMCARIPAQRLTLQGYVSRNMATKVGRRLNELWAIWEAPLESKLLWGGDPSLLTWPNLVRMGFWYMPLMMHMMSPRWRMSRRMRTVAAQGCVLEF